MLSYPEPPLLFDTEQPVLCASLTWGGDPQMLMVNLDLELHDLSSEDTDWSILPCPIIWQMSLTWGG